MDFSTPQANSQAYYQVVISASQVHHELSVKEIEAKILSELKSIWPAANAENFIRSQYVTKKRAVFSATVDLPQKRPPQVTNVSGLLLAGDWTQTNWPSTMEGAVRSGFLAAEALIQQLGKSEKVCVDDLTISPLSRWLWSK